MDISDSLYLVKCKFHLEKFNIYCSFTLWIDNNWFSTLLPTTQLWKLKFWLQFFLQQIWTAHLACRLNLISASFPPSPKSFFFIFLPQISVLTISFCKFASCTSMSTCHCLFLCPCVSEWVSVWVGVRVCKSRYNKWLNGHRCIRADMSRADLSVCSVCSSGASNQISCN